jgi:hypothetical protein
VNDKISNRINNNQREQQSLEANSSINTARQHTSKFVENDANENKREIRELDSKTGSYSSTRKEMGTTSGKMHNDGQYQGELEKIGNDQEELSRFQSKVGNLNHKSNNSHSFHQTGLTYLMFRSTRL